MTASREESRRAADELNGLEHRRRVNTIEHQLYKAAASGRITHSGEKSNKCNQCDFASDLKTHLKTHSGEREDELNRLN